MSVNNRWIADSIVDVDFQDVYSLGKALGDGSSAFTKTFQCAERATFEQWTVKILNKQEYRSRPDRQVSLGLFRRLVHPNLARLREIYETEAEVFLVVELLNGGEVFDRIELKYNLYSERDAKKWIRELLQAIQYLHENDVIHGNLKAENLLLDGISEVAKLKITDFYMLVLLQNDVRRNSVCFTPGYAAPEILRGERCSKATDIWSIGVITYLVLSGNEPFFATRDSELFRKILRVKYDLRSYDWEGISLTAKDFVSRLLVKDPEKRMSASVALSHPWISGTVTKNESLEGVQDRIKLFNSRRKLNLAIEVVSAANYEEMRILYDSISFFYEQPSVSVLDSSHALALSQMTKVDTHYFHSPGSPSFHPGPLPGVPPTSPTHIDQANEFVALDDKPSWTNLVSADETSNSEAAVVERHSIHSNNSQ